MADNNIGNVDPHVTRRKKQRSYVSPRSTVPKDNLYVYGIENSLFLFLLVFRIWNAFVIKTFFVPDEFWQGPEIAHRVVFGYGYLTWEWKEGLRGWTAPLIYAISYKLLAFFGLDTSITVVMAPRIIQSVFASFGDLFLYKLAVKNFDIQTGAWTLICYLLSWFTFYIVTRTLTNSLETVLTTVALFYWPLKANEEIDVKLLIKALGFAALSCIIRPTAAIIWILLCARHIFLTLHKLRFIFEILLPVGLLAMLWSVVLNSCLYNRWTFVELNFVKFNVLNNMGTFYGSHPWHW